MRQLEAIRVFIGHYTKKHNIAIFIYTMDRISFVSTTVEQIEYGSAGLSSSKDTAVGVKEIRLQDKQDVKVPLPSDGKSLYEQLQERKLAAEAEAKAKYGPLHKPPKALDEEDVRFLEENERKRREQAKAEQAAAEMDKAAYELALSEVTVLSEGKPSAQAPKRSTDASVTSGSLIESLSKRLTRPRSEISVSSKVEEVPQEKLEEMPDAKKRKLVTLVDYDSESSESAS